MKGEDREDAVGSVETVRKASSPGQGGSQLENMGDCWAVLGAERLSGKKLL